MIGRCGNPNGPAYHRYGGRGITVCERWRSFANFRADMGSRPTPQHTIERIDNDRGYEPSNCRWATRREQQNNMRRNRYVTLRGERMTVAQAARAVGVCYETMHGRVRKGLNLETGERHAD